jgi:hypothetical protein
MEAFVARRERRRQMRAEMEERRRYGLKARHRAKLARASSADDGRALRDYGAMKITTAAAMAETQADPPSAGESTGAAPVDAARMVLLGVKAAAPTDSVRMVPLGVKPAAADSARIFSSTRSLRRGHRQRSHVQVQL